MPVKVEDMAYSDEEAITPVHVTHAAAQNRLCSLGSILH